MQNQSQPDVRTENSVPGGDGPTTTAAVASAAGDAGSEVGHQAKRVADDAVAQARSVIGEATGQARNLVGQAGDEVRTQAEARASQAAGALRTLSDQVGALAAGRPNEAGPLGGYLDDARNQLGKFASKLDERGLDGLISDVTNFARRRPVVFLAAAAGAGFVAGRLVRAGASASSNGSTSSSSDGRVVASTRPTDTPELAPPLAAPSTGVVVP